MKKYYPYLSALLVFICYLFTIAPSVIQIDSGELAAVQATFGIAHPTGYPIFTLIGYLFLQFPLPFSKIFMSNLFAALFTSASVIFLSKTAYLYLSDITSVKEIPQTRKKKKTAITVNLRIDENLKIFLSISTAIFIAFSKTFWFQSASVEVYSLHLFLLSVIIYLAVLIHTEKEEKNNLWYLLALFVGLGFSNHMTTLLAVPGIIFIFFYKRRLDKSSILFGLRVALISLVVIILSYSILVIRASYDPILNWGNPENFENLLRHISGKQYQVWLFSSIAAAKKQLMYFISNLSSEYNYAILSVFAAGIFFFLKSSRTLFWFTTINFLFTILYASNYDINDIDSYFLLAYVSIGFFVLAGIIFILQYLNKKNLPSYVVALFTGLLLSAHFILNYSEVDQSGTYIYEDYTKAVLESVEENALIFSYQWDYFISASYYFQHVENFRSESIIIDKELLRRSWYYDQLENCYPNIFTGIENDVSSFKEHLKPFERGENFNSSRLEYYFQRIMTGLAANQIQSHPFYLGPEIADNEMKQGGFNLPEGYSIVPHNLLFKVVSASEYSECPLPEFKIRLPETKTKYSLFIERLTVGMLSRRALYELEFNQTERTKLYVEKILREFPGNSIPPALSEFYSKVKQR
ncbi:MAG: DUF2723 domain-containing protein [Bacteroidetes bacterium]|nr:DUF2723 domain-containing protein [Bacteroidota bacterium]